jgi:hypothetical protein
MKHELKVILGDSTANTIVLVDNNPIGLIQEISFKASVEHQAPEIEIVFPNLHLFASTNKELVNQLEAQVQLLKELPQVKVTIRDIKL